MQDKKSVKVLGYVPSAPLPKRPTVLRKIICASGTNQMQTQSRPTLPQRSNERVIYVTWELKPNHISAGATNQSLPHSTAGLRSQLRGRKLTTQSGENSTNQKQSHGSKNVQDSKYKASKHIQIKGERYIDIPGSSRPYTTPVYSISSLQSSEQSRHVATANVDKLRTRDNKPKADSLPPINANLKVIRFRGKSSRTLFYGCVSTEVISTPREESCNGDYSLNRSQTFCISDKQALGFDINSHSTLSKRPKTVRFVNVQHPKTKCRNADSLCIRGDDSDFNDTPDQQTFDSVKAFESNSDKTSEDCRSKHANKTEISESVCHDCKNATSNTKGKVNAEGYPEVIRVRQGPPLLPLLFL